MKLYVDGYIGEIWDFWSDDIPTTTYKGLKAKLDDSGEELEIHFNSKGGDAFEGMAMLNMLKSYDGEKVAIIDGICASAATLPLFAMDKVKAHETSLLLFHKSGTMAYGHASDLRKSADELDTIDDTIVDLYMSRFTGTSDELIALLDEDRLMSAKEALEFGLIDEIIPDEDDKKKKEEAEDEDDKEKDEKKVKQTLEDVSAMAEKHVDETSEMVSAFMKALDSFKL